ncbi:AAA family ATPase [Sphingobacterium siyangense]|uniref:AAA family ATPase n=1 Tax=Sphingobacterium siyangense TaxID=459529 RepID=UPI0019624488|nr:AAA family ATPase [Sphingobacterium siyangense]QRY55980.1 AAA family ATPase [Sphingobacterium siyangense]
MTDKTITKTTTRRIISLIIPQWERIANDDIDKAIRIIELVWSEISESLLGKDYKSIEEDLVQHYVRNNDYETGYLFEEILKAYSLSFSSIKLLIESLLEPVNFNDVDSITSFSTVLDYELLKEDLRLVVIRFDDLNFPVQIVEEIKNFDDLPPGVKVNDIPFYVDKGTRIVKEEDTYFVLSPNKGWNDFGVVAIFQLNYYYDTNDSGRYVNLGSFKIIHAEERRTWEHLPDKFFRLTKDFCSLGDSDGYYSHIINLFGFDNTISILFALQDAGYFTDIQERFEKTYNYIKSLLRNDSGERYLREVRPFLNGTDMKNYYSFSYNFRPAYSDETTEVNIGFNTQSPIADRIFAVIGKNGTGKTQLLNSLPHNLAKKDLGVFNGKFPSFSKVIAISYSVFDSFSLPQKNVNLNYVYCGLKDAEGDIRSNKGLAVSFHHNWKRIQDQKRIDKWKKILLNFIEKEIIESFINDDNLIYNENNPAVSIEDYNKVKSKLSSGQSILLYIITQVVANIRFDSLILYDEPETHLHPNAVVELMNTLYDLVNEFESFCIIATHSPIVIRELFSKNVYVLERESNIPSLRRINIECFGENLGILTEEVFGDRGVSKQYKKILIRLVSEGKSFDEILDILEYDEVPLSLNARIYLKHIIEK